MTYKLLHRANYILATALLIFPQSSMGFRYPAIYLSMFIFCISILIAFTLKLLISEKQITINSVGTIAIKTILKIILVGVILIFAAELCKVEQKPNMNFAVNLYRHFINSIPIVLSYTITYFFFCLIIGVFSMLPALAVSPVILKVYEKYNKKWN